MVKIRKAKAGDEESIWKIIQSVIRSGDTYTFDPDSSRNQMLDYWLGSDKHAFVAEDDGKIVGTFIIKSNQPGLGSHVANASYMTSPQSFGKGIGKTMGEQSLKIAKELGYKAMQFNIVVKSNERAVKLWQKLGFQIMAEIPDSFNHSQLGLINTYIMWREL